MRILEDARGYYNGIVSSTTLLNFREAFVITVLGGLLAVSVYEMYTFRTSLDPAEANALLNTLLICDILIFCLSFIAIILSWRISSAKGIGVQASIFGSLKFILFVIVMLSPIIFIGCQLSFKPGFFSEGMEVDIAIALSAIGVISLMPLTILIIKGMSSLQNIKAFIRDMKSEYLGSGEECSLEDLSMLKQVYRGTIETRLLSQLARLSTSGDSITLELALDDLKDTCIDAKSDDPRSIALASGMAGLLAEAGINAAKDGNITVVRMVIDRLSEITKRSGKPGVSSLALRGMGAIYLSCESNMGEQVPRVQIKLASTYASLYDSTGKRECLELAMKMSEKAVAAYGESQHSDELIDALFVSGRIYRMAAELESDESSASISIARLTEALSLKNGIASPLDQAFIKNELGKAFIAMAKIRNPIKSYKSAVSAFSEASDLVTPGISKWDHSLILANSGYAYTMLADEYFKIRKFDEAISSARSAISSYSLPVQFFTLNRSAEDHASIMSNLGLAHTVISEIYSKSRMFEEALKHAHQALDSYTDSMSAYSKISTSNDLASIKTSIGLTYMTIADICFREKRYQEAISACDNAIAAYNEAVRIYDESGREKPASTVRKYLKDANDLFGTMMRIGSGGKSGNIIE
ncbi:hypothetical protein CUJ83_09120 [Methanocella sp. CWC-04]|uniref:Tetratricopeptide repeat-containing protein n=1 Tax=Methanooceanicella nereidis TaxID=2052831 RepID=A0AAP2RFA2_9EURY|nr:hypothetical protein [Methanocella sp. CWC-04]MCD1295157.1 hypothetical protein [Methanocella sp. CWC-04]